MYTVHIQFIMVLISGNIWISVFELSSVSLLSKVNGYVVHLLVIFNYTVTNFWRYINCVVVCDVRSIFGHPHLPLLHFFNEFLQIVCISVKNKM